MNTNCQNCDRADCPTLTLPTITAITAESVAAIDDCCNNTINWRARALTETARADAAEAELRALREALPKWRDDVLTTPVGAKIGFIESYSTYWLAMLDGEISVGRAGEIGKARRLVEQHHGLPPCEVLP